MKILITGGTGFIGQALCKNLKTEGHSLWILTRNVKRATELLPYEEIRFIQDFSEIKPVDYFDAVINLAGEPIAKRWSADYKQTLLTSRIDLTRRLINKLKTLKNPPQVLISGSAVGFYGAHGDETLTEAAPGKAGFSHELCQAWEKEAWQAQDFGMRVCLLRIGIVLGKKGGALSRMRLPFLMGLGGPIGTGAQWMSWIHLDDIVRIIIFCLHHHEIQGPINATAPNPQTNKAFASIYGNVLHRPAKLSMPAFPLRLIYGQMANELLLTGQKVLPNKLIQSGFHFLYPDLREALKHT